MKKVLLTLVMALAAMVMTIPAHAAVTAGACEDLNPK